MFYKDLEEFKSLNGYEIDGVWYPRVTKIVGVKAKPGLDAFFREMESYAQAEDAKNKSAAQGSLVHDAIERLLMGETPAIPDEVAPAVKAFEEFNREQKIVAASGFVERRVWSSRHRYAGTVDALATINGKFGVLDIKTSTGFYPEYNLQTAAYVSALQEFLVRRMLNLPREVETRWILRVDQHRVCRRCAATLREKGGRNKVRKGKNGAAPCEEESHHDWGERRGIVELREFPYVYRDTRAFMAAKILWEWDNDYWLKQAGYVKKFLSSSENSVS